MCVHLCVCVCMPERDKFQNDMKLAFDGGSASCSGAQQAVTDAGARELLAC